MRKREKAFTLIELIISTSILAFLMLTVYSVFYNNSLVWEEGNTRIQMYQGARVCLDTMAREIRSAFISSSNPYLTFKGDRCNLNYVCASNKVNRSGEYDLCEVGYSLKGSNLYRRMRSVLSSVPGENGTSSVLAPYILSLNFMYYDGVKWRESWDSTMGTPEDTSDDGLPFTVKITITTQGEQDAEACLTLSTVVNIPQRE